MTAQTATTEPEELVLHVTPGSLFESMMVVLYADEGRTVAEALAIVAAHGEGNHAACPAKWCSEA